MNQLLFSIFVVFLFVYENEAKNFTQCELALELEKHDVDRDDIEHFVCLVANNALDSTWTGGPYGDSTRNFGLFQVNNNDWCIIGRQGGNCSINCNELADDDITDDIACAKQIKKLYGFDPWWVWRRECKSSRPNLDHCYPDDCIENRIGEDDSTKVGKGSSTGGRRKGGSTPADGGGLSLRRGCSDKSKKSGNSTDVLSIDDSTGNSTTANSSVALISRFGEDDDNSENDKNNSQPNQPIAPGYPVPYPNYYPNPYPYPPPNPYPQGYPYPPPNPYVQPNPYPPPNPYPNVPNPYGNVPNPYPNQQNYYPNPNLLSNQYYYQPIPYPYYG